ncbi:MAG: FAD-binding oxidoreductase [Rhodobacteraceae bacterium]|nr:FAD-binding oxidoreductase [Paracoccaceae bacterium]
MARVDITVRGAGIFGLSIAWACAARGARVRVIDPFGVGAGASGGIVGAMAPHVPEAWNAKKAFQLDSLLMAEGWWGQVAAAGGTDPGYGRTGRLQPLADAAAVSMAEARAKEAQVLWQGRAVWQVVQATGAAWEPASATGLLVHDTLSARIHPRMALAALVSAIRAVGGEVVQDAPDTGLIVHATGIAGLEALTAATGRKQGGGVKGQAVALRYSGATLPQLFIDGLHIVPHADRSVVIGSTSENHWQDATATDQQLDALHAAAVAALPVLAGAPVIERWAALRPRATSRAPLLGLWPGRQGHFLANGGFKIGFGMAPLVAEVMADLMLDGVDRVPADFHPH